jgi:hypothetical protein
MARGPVFERGGARCVGRNGPTRERAVKGRRRRVVEAAVREHTLQLREGNTGAHANGPVTWFVDFDEPPRAEQNIAARRCAAGQRRLRANRQHAGGLGHGGRDFIDISGEYDARRDAPGDVCGIAEKGSEQVGVVLDGRDPGRWRTARRNAMS